MNKIKKIIVILFLLSSLIIISGCRKNKDDDKNNKTETYTITYELDGGTQETNLYSYKKGETINLPVPTKKGYKFLGWNIDSVSNTTPITSLYECEIGDIVLIALWEKEEYIISFSELTVSDIAYTIEDEVILPIPTKEGYNFGGWYLTDDFSTEQISRIEKGTTENYHFYAKWINKEKTYTIKFRDVNLDPITFTASQEVILPVPDVEGYIFFGWFRDYAYTGEPIIKVEKGTTRNLTFIPKLEKGNHIKYNVNNGIMPDEYNEYYLFESEYELPKPTREGYKFIGWSEKENISTNLMYSIPISYEEDLELYAAWEKQIYNVQYNLGKNIYANHKQLYRDFFGDFYYYIKDYKKAEWKLEQTGAYSLDDFLNICSAYTGGSAGMGDIGNKYSTYYLRLDTGGKLENQTADDGFIGYCLANNMYVEFIYFLQEFFYAWRLDEGYTNGPDDPNGTGSDFLASPWASLVDTAKFFYYEKSTLPSYFFGETDTVPFFYDRIPYVVYTDGVEFNYQYDWEEGLDLLDTLTIEGYTFYGWYDNPDFAGEPIAKIETNIYHDIVVYAKLVKNENN